MSLADIAYAHNDARTRLGHDLASRLVRLWRTVPLNDLDAGWARVAPQMRALVKEAQLTAASQAESYLAALDKAWAFDSKPAAIVPLAFADVMGDGREVVPALFGAVTNTKQLIGSGVLAPTAFESGAAFLALVAQTALHDLGRNADKVLGAGRGYPRYIRVVNGSACSRCAILAGIGSAEEAFRRHTGCQCGAVLVPEGAKVPKGLYDSPQAHFDSLSKAEQDRVYTKAGAEAIRQGANPVQVVNARRGASGIGYSGHQNAPSIRRGSLKPIQIGVRADGSPLTVYATSEGTTARGQFYKSESARVRAALASGRYTRTATVRLMPEQIAVMAGSDPERWVVLLRRYGYLE